MEQKGTIFDIKKFAIHDGPGIRSTVFFKGCPLRCSWCHNPEGISFLPQVMLTRSRCLAGCRACVLACPQKALTRKKNAIALARERCHGCGRCASVCPAEALQMTGSVVSVDQVMAALGKDDLFYRESAGGVTFSGGEPLEQLDFLYALLQAAKKQGWHTAVDTCGQAVFAGFTKIMPLVDLFLYDLKIMDAEKHRRLTGSRNELILENLSKLSRLARALAIRIPLIPGSNDSQSDLEQLADFCASLPRRHAVHLLPYHQGGNGKRKRLDQTEPLPLTRPPSAVLMQKAKDIFLKRKLSVMIGG